MKRTACLGALLATVLGPTPDAAAQLVAVPVTTRSGVVVPQPSDLRKRGPAIGARFWVPPAANQSVSKLVVRFDLDLGEIETILGPRPVTAREPDWFCDPNLVSCP